MTHVESCFHLILTLSLRIWSNSFHVIFSFHEIFVTLGHLVHSACTCVRAAQLRNVKDRRDHRVNRGFVQEIKIHRGNGIFPADMKWRMFPAKIEYYPRNQIFPAETKYSPRPRKYSPRKWMQQYSSRPRKYSPRPTKYSPRQKISPAAQKIFPAAKNIPRGPENIPRGREIFPAAEYLLSYVPPRLPHVPYYSCQKMITIGFTRTMYVCELQKPVEFYHPIAYFAVFLIPLQIFTNAMERADRVHFTRSMVYISWLITEMYTRMSPHVLN